jgi:hypothetical protein
MTLTNPQKMTTWVKGAYSNMASDESERGQGSGFSDIQRVREACDYPEAPDLLEAGIVKCLKSLARARGAENVVSHAGSFGL